MASRLIKDLHPTFQPMVRDLLKWSRENLGEYEAFITDGYRSNEEQTKLYNQGRTTPGKIVTYAKAGQSAHNYGLAVDLAFRRQGTKEAKWLISKYQKLAGYAKTKGFEWGGDWKFKDNPHFAIKDWQKLKNSDGGSMSPGGDTITIPKKTFEKLVTNSSRYDQFKNKGFENPDQIQDLINKYEEDLKTERRTNGENAEKWRKEHQNVVRELANLLNTSQKLPDILGEVNILLEKEEELRKLKPVSENERKEFSKQKADLEAEISRLTALLNHQEVLSNVTVEEMIAEIIKRILKIIRRES